MKILVTGGGGSIGVYVVRALLSRGDAVTIVDNFNDFYDPRLKRFRLTRLLEGLPQPFVAEVDITNAAALSKVFSDVRPTHVIHLAAWPSVQPSVRYPQLYTEQNVVGTVNVLQASVDAAVDGVVIASSSSVYGRNTPVPFREDAPCHAPLAPYSASKRAAELYASMYHSLHALHVTCLRFFTVYGPWIRPDMAPWKLTANIVHGEPIELRSITPHGEEVQRDFTYVDDIVRGVLSALDHLRGFDMMNLGNDDPVSLSRFVRAIEQGLGRKAIIHDVALGPEEAIVTAADLTHAREVLGYAPTISIEEGMQRVADWYTKEFSKVFPSGLIRSAYWS